MARSDVAWLVLLVSGALECAWVVGLKYSEGFTRLVPAVLTVIAMGSSLGGLTWALKYLPTGTAYAVWTGIGAAGAALMGILLFAEPATALRFVSIGLIIAGIIGLRLAS